MDLFQLQASSENRVRALFGLSRAALGELFTAVLPVLLDRRTCRQQDRSGRQRAVGGGRKWRLKPYQEVLLTLVYLRHNVAHAGVGALFGVSADTSENTFYEVVAVLRDVCPANRWKAEKHWKRGEPSWKPDELDHGRIDSLETPVPRPSEPTAQKGRY
jgi:hypothetical protein